MKHSPILIARCLQLKEVVCLSLGRFSSHCVIFKWCIVRQLEKWWEKFFSKSTQRGKHRESMCRCAATRHPSCFSAELVLYLSESVSF